MLGGSDLLERLRELPGGPELLRLAARREDVELVGGAVRDLLLGRTPRELDVVVGGPEQSFDKDAQLFARELASQLGVLSGENEPKEHERFVTALVQWDGGQVDIATRRKESYSAPGALPAVSAGTPAQDLARRDFTVNAIALALGGAHRGELRHAPRALEDLEGARVRVLHERSFLDDPTRLMRLARYGTRLGFTTEEETARLAQTAIRGGAIATVSGARLGAELRLALSEPDASSTLAELQRLGLLAALHPRLRFEEPLARRALELLGEGERPDLLLLAVLAVPLTLRADGDRGVELRALLDRLQFSAADRDTVVASALAAPHLIEVLAASASASELFEGALGTPAEGIALAGALDGERPASAAAARRWLRGVRHVRLEITGDDLIAAGIQRGPELGARLQAVLRLRLDEALPEGREAELAAALEWRPR